VHTLIQVSGNAQSFADPAGHVPPRPTPSAQSTRRSCAQTPAITHNTWPSHTFPHRPGLTSASRRAPCNGQNCSRPWVCSHSSCASTTKRQTQPRNPPQKCGEMSFAPLGPGNIHTRAGVQTAAHAHVEVLLLGMVTCRGPGHMSRAWSHVEGLVTCRGPGHMARAWSHGDDLVKPRQSCWAAVVAFAPQTSEEAGKTSSWIPSWIPSGRGRSRRSRVQSPAR